MMAPKMELIQLTYVDVDITEVRIASGLYTTEVSVHNFIKLSSTFLLEKFSILLNGMSTFSLK